MYGDRMRAWREARGLSASEVARKLGVTRQAVSAWERGAYKPSHASLAEWCKLLRVEGDDRLELVNLVGAA